MHESGSFVFFKYSIYLDNILQAKFITIPKNGGDSVFFLSAAGYLQNFAALVEQ